MSFFSLCVTTYVIVIDNIINFFTIAALIFLFCWVIKLLYEIYKIIIDIYRENIIIEEDEVLVILEKYYDGTFKKNKKYYEIYFNNRKTPYKYSGCLGYISEDDFVKFTYLGRCNIIHTITKM